MPKVKSRAQAGLFGIVAGGGTPTKHPKAAKIGRAKAKSALRGKKLKRLPARKAKKK